MSESGSTQEEESLDLPRVFKRERSVDMNEGTISEEEEFFGFDTESEGLILTQSSLFSSLPPTQSADFETATELDNTEVASSASDIGSAIFDHDYICTQDFQENIQLAMRRSDSTDDQAIRQLMYDDDGIKFNVQDIEGRFKLLINISSSILNSRSAELADHASITNFLSKLCEQTESLKHKFAQASSGDDAQIPDTDSGRASKTPPSMGECPLLEEPLERVVKSLEEGSREKINNLDAPGNSRKEILNEQPQDEAMAMEIDPKEPQEDALSEASTILQTEAPGEPQIEPTTAEKEAEEVPNPPSSEIEPQDTEQDNPATCLDEASMAEYTEVLEKVDFLSKLGTDVVTSMDEMRKNLPLTVSAEVLTESRGIFRKKVLELQQMLKSLIFEDISAEIGIQTEEESCQAIPEVSEATCESSEKDSGSKEINKVEIGVQTFEEPPLERISIETQTTGDEAEPEEARIEDVPMEDQEAVPEKEPEPLIEKILKTEEPELDLVGELPGNESDFDMADEDLTDVEGELPGDVDGKATNAEIEGEPTGLEGEKDLAGEKEDLMGEKAEVERKSPESAGEDEEAEVSEEKSEAKVSGDRPEAEVSKEMSKVEDSGEKSEAQVSRERSEAEIPQEVGEANLSAGFPETEDPNDISLENEAEEHETNVPEVEERKTPEPETLDKAPEGEKEEASEEAPTTEIESPGEKISAEQTDPDTSVSDNDEPADQQLLDKTVDPANLLVITKVESTEIQNERMKRKLLDMLDSSSDEAFSEDDTDDDPTFTIRMLNRKRRKQKRIRDESEEEDQEKVETPVAEEDKAVSAKDDVLTVEDSQIVEDALTQDSSEFDLLNYTTSDLEEEECFLQDKSLTEEAGGSVCEASGKSPESPVEKSKEINEFPEDLLEGLPGAVEASENVQDDEISTEQIAKEALDIVKEEMSEGTFDDVDLSDAVPAELLEAVDLLDKLPDEADMLDINDAEPEVSEMEDNTDLTSIVEETKNVILLNNQEISSQDVNERPKENGHDEEDDQMNQMDHIEEENQENDASIRSCHPVDLDRSMSSETGDSDSSKDVPASSLEPVISVVETMDKKSLEDFYDDINDKEIDKLLDFTSLERRRYESSRVTESKETDKPRRQEKKKDKLLDILQEVKVGEVTESSSESEEDELTEEQFLQQCNMNMKHRLLNFSSDESGEESNDLSLNKLYKKKSGDEDDDVDSINSDASAIVDDFLMNIVQKKIAEDVGEEKANGEEEKGEDEPKENHLQLNESEEVQEVPEAESSARAGKENDPAVDSPSDVQIVEDTQEEREGETAANGDGREAETEGDEGASVSKPKAPKVSSVEKIIMSDKIFEGIDVRKDLMKEKIPKQLKIMSSDEESERESKDDGCLDTSMFNKKVTPKSSEEINRILAKYEINKGTTSHSKDTRPPSETISLSSDSDVDEVVEEEAEREGGPRRNIRAMLSEDQLEVETKRAQREERERIVRLEKKTDSLTQRMSQTENLSQDDNEIVLDYHTKTKKFITVHPAIVRQLKPHQIDGVRFMYDNVYGGVDYVDKHAGSGCILAHCMGLGKTLQLIALLHTVIRYQELKTNRILVICPKTTIMNWFEEIRKWLKPVLCDVSMKVFFFPDNSDIYGKLKILKEWHKSGEKGYKTAGCLLIGYEAFRVLVLKQSKKQSLYTQQESALIKKQVSETLLDPGADLVICDEGHMIKNKKSAINQAVTKIRTKRRIILTGTPIQNNLKEYYCMVNFIKPNFLGTEKEFANLYTNPIKSGQHKDSTKQEIKCMKQRSYVLHKKLSRFVQRREAAVLKQFLPEKFEYVLFIPMTEVQERLYEFFLVNNPNKEISGKSLIPDYTALRKIWTHPKVLENAWENAMIAREKKERARARLQPESEDEAPDDVLDKQVGVMSVMNDWWRAHLTRDDLESILPTNGEKCLIFSAFVAVLNVVEHFMRKISNKTPETSQRYGLEGYEGPWEHGKDFYRLDGKTPKTLRHSMVQSFNDPLNTRMRVFLISAKAGGQGINLTGANRVIILDTSWNPSNDQQNIFRIYRLGQERKCYVYRLLAMGTMEEKVYSRSVTKQAMSFRVVDEQQIDRHYSMAELAELYTLTKTDMSQRPVPNLPTDFLLRNLLHNHFNLIYKYHEHDSLLENKPEQDLSEADKKEAWDAYENDLKTQRSGAFDQSALSQGLLGLNNYFNAANSNIPGAMGYSNPVGRPYGSSNYAATSLYNQLSSYQPGMGMNQELMLMNQLYQSYPMGMGSSGMQNPYMGYMNQSSYYGGGLYPTSSNSSIASTSSLGSQYKSLQNLAEIAMMPEANLIPTTSGSPSGAALQHIPTASSPGMGSPMVTSPSSAMLQRSTPSRSMWNLMGAPPSYYTPGTTTSQTAGMPQSGMKTTQASSTATLASVSSTTLPGASSRSFGIRDTAALGPNSPHTSIPTSVITTVASTSSGLMSTFTRAESNAERPSSSTSPQPHVILKATNSPAIHQKEKELTPTKVTNMGIVYPTMESRESTVPSLASLSPATITKIAPTQAQKTPTTMANALNTKLSSLLGLHNVTVTPSAKVTKPSSTTLTPIVTTTVKQGVKVTPTSSPKVQSAHSVTVKPTTVATTTNQAAAKRQAYVYTAKGKKPVQMNQQQRVLVGNQTSITPIRAAVPAAKATTLTPVTLVRTPIGTSQVGTSAKPQGAHLTRSSRLVPSTITSPQIAAVQQGPKVQQPVQLQKIQQPVQLQKVQQPTQVQKAQGQFQKVQQPVQLHKTQQAIQLQKLEQQKLEQQQQIVQRVRQTIQNQKAQQSPQQQLQKVQISPQQLQKVQVSPQQQLQKIQLQAQQQKGQQTIQLQKVQQPSTMQVQRIQQPVQLQKLQQPPQLIKVQSPGGKPGITRTVTIRKPQQIQIQTAQPGAPKLLNLPQKRPSTTPITELIGNSGSVSITQVKKPNLATTSKPIPAPQSSATLQKLTVPARRTVHKVPPTVVSKDPEIVELD
uniref:Putative dna repair protein snf2 family n=1 Tax=Lutzomyia longipalpis TaxID=7200 RepID=A0A1B0CAC6_LUTLO